jgi:glycerate 2-kinase
MTGGRQFRDDLALITAAAIEAVKPEALFKARLAVEDEELRLDGRSLAPLPVAPGRITVVGGGKAAAGMAAGLVEILAAGGVTTGRIEGLVSVPEGCERTVAGIEIRATRPASENLPTPVAVAATREMLAVVSTLGPGDLAVALVSGGGSALLAAPRAGVSLAEKIALTRFLSAAGAGITELNLVRQAASDVKGGGLARACGAGRLLVVVLSDVIGDPLEAVASGPCLPAAASAAAAVAVLERFGATEAAPRVTALLRAEAARGNAGGGGIAAGGTEAEGSAAGTAVGTGTGPASRAGSWTTPRGCRVEHVLIGNNATAGDAAAAAARQLGYEVTSRPAAPGFSETADEAGRRLAHEAFALAASAAADGRPRAVIEGGEAVVRLPADHGTGGRNQQTVAAALGTVLGTAAGWPAGLLLASLGTDGEDGPTTAAGGFADAGVAAAIAAAGLDVAAAVARCDTLPLLNAAGGLVVTGPTGTNVADLRIVLAWPQSSISQTGPT